MVPAALALARMGIYDLFPDVTVDFLCSLARNDTRMLVVERHSTLVHIISYWDSS